MRKWLLRMALAVVALVVLVQLVPYGRDHKNPPVLAQPSWDSARTRALAKDACFDCHSNVTTWPWYSNVAPVSWLVYQHVVDGRRSLNFSEWNRPQDGAGDAIEVISSRDMPPTYYTLLHPKARLSSTERAHLIAGLVATFKRSPPLGGG